MFCFVFLVMILKAEVQDLMLLNLRWLKIEELELHWKKQPMRDDLDNSAFLVSNPQLREWEITGEIISSVTWERHQMPSEGSFHAVAMAINFKLTLKGTSHIQTIVQEKASEGFEIENRLHNKYIWGERCTSEMLWESGEELTKKQLEIQGFMKEPDHKDAPNSPGWRKYFTKSWGSLVVNVLKTWVMIGTRGKGT